MKLRKELIIFPIGCAAIPLVCVPSAEWMAVAPQGNERGLWYISVLVFPVLISIPVFILSLVGLAFSRFRRVAGVLALCSVAYFGAFVLSLRIGDSIRMNAFASLAERSKPLITAIRAYEQKNGRPPESLSDLVPEFISEIPSTGMGAYPEYDYSTSSTSFDGNPWVLSVYTPSGGINFDQFLYFPLTNYPKSGYGGWLERVGDWAYVHE